jgi:outer membrane biosynthesis protein TonB
MRTGRLPATLAVATLVLAACGSGAADTPAAEPADAPAATDGVQQAPEDPVTDESPTPPTTGDTSAPDADEPSAGQTDTTDGSGEPSTSDAPAVQPAVEPEPEPEPEPAPVSDTPTAPAWPDDGCSADNSPTPTESADGPAPVVEIRAESADSPLPDLAVRRVNCNGGWVNLRNELPSTQPLLVWFWAPH